MQVPDRCIYGFLGPNGAGKTTTIKMLVGFSKPTSGSVFIDGKELTYGISRYRDIGYLPDIPNFYNWMSSVDLLRYYGRLHSIDGNDLNHRIEFLLSLVGLAGVNKKIGGFSRGMKQRLGIAQALINNPKIIILDEPTSALDPIGRKEILDLILKLANDVTIIFSSHILTDIERVCNRVLIIQRGKEVVENTIANLKKLYATDTLEIELNCKETVKTINDLLIGCSWVSRIDVLEDKKIQIHVTDLGKAQIEIPGIISSANIPLNKFNILEPSLEDIFVNSVSGK
jgi:ABC-2 type transport system ATP-binding protein